jgi:intracellular multiplication protein IcmO
MMGSTLGATVEGESATVIENKPTNSATPFMVVFDEVGYYTAAGMAVMAAQARSLGFCLIFSAQDLPALEKRVKEEARSIAANCNIKIFGKLEDPTQTKEFFEKTVGSSYVTEVSGFASQAGGMTRSYMDNMQAGIQNRGRSNYDSVRSFKEGQAVIAFGERVVDVRMFYSNPGHAKAMRVTRYVALPVPDEAQMKHVPAITKLRDLMVKKGWSAVRADVALDTSNEVAAMADALTLGYGTRVTGLDCGLFCVAGIYGLSHPISLDETPMEPENIAVEPQAQQPASNPAPFFGSAPGAPGSAVNWANLDSVPQEEEVSLDQNTQDILRDAARKARESIFRSTGKLATNETTE